MSPIPSTGRSIYHLRVGQTTLPVHRRKSKAEVKYQPGGSQKSGETLLGLFTESLFSAVANAGMAIQATQIDMMNCNHTRCIDMTIVMSKLAERYLT